jgi:hypothetical protein
MLWLLVSDYWIGESVYKAQLQWNAAGVGPAGSRRRARRVGTDGGKPSRNGCDLFAPVGADKKTPASRRTRVRYREWRMVFLEEAKPASVIPRARVGGRFVLLDVEMTRLACFRRKCLLGRNLITLFQCVNSFAKIFLPAPAPGSRHRRIALPRIGAHDTHRTAHHDRTLLKKAAFNALFFDTCSARPELRLRSMLVGRVHEIPADE